jgi:hypothetical protein
MNRNSGYSDTTFFSSDFTRITDRCEPVTLLRCSGNKEFISHAIQMPFSKSVRSDKKYSFSVAGLAIWMIPHNECRDMPYSGDKIIDTKDHIWTVVYTQNRIDRWDVTTRNEMLSAAFDQDISIESPVFSRNAAGDQRIEWKVVMTGLRAEIISIETDAAKALSGKQSVRILLLGQLSLNNGCRLRGASNCIYSIVSFMYPSQFPGATEICAEMETNPQN